MRAPLRAFSSAPSPRPRGNPGRAERGHPGRRSRSDRRIPPPLVIPAKAGIHLLLPWPLTLARVGRRRADGSGPRVSAGEREGSRSFRCRAGCPVSGTPAARSEPARSAGVPPGCPLFGYFLWASRESDPAARMADGTTPGRESVFAKRRTSKSKEEADGFRLPPE